MGKREGKLKLKVSFCLYKRGFLQAYSWPQKYKQKWSHKACETIILLYCQPERSRMASDDLQQVLLHLHVFREKHLLHHVQQEHRARVHVLHLHSIEFFG